MARKPPTTPSVVLKNTQQSKAQQLAAKAAAAAGTTPPKGTYAGGTTPSANNVGMAPTKTQVGSARTYKSTVKVNRRGLVQSPVASVKPPVTYKAPVKKSDPPKVAKGTGVTDVAPAGAGARGSAGAGMSPTPTKPVKASPTDVIGLNGNIGQMIDPSYADAIAGGTYDPVINDLNNQLGMLPGQTKQNKADITNWMNQVIASLSRSNTRADNNYDAATTSAGDTAKGIIASLGGSDNPAGGMIGASGANAAEMMQALKGNQDAFAGDMTPILNLEKSSQLNNQQATSDTLSRDLMSQLASAQGQRSGLSAQTQMQITQLNNALAQQRFGNAFGIDQANLAAQVASGQTNLNNLYKQAQIKKINAGLNNPSAPKGSYGATTPSDRARIAAQINSAVQTLKASNPNIGAQPVIQMINGMLNTTGWNMNDPGVSSWRNGVFTTVGINPTTQSWTAG